MTKSELKNRLDKTIEHFQTEIGRIRTGRASPSLLENIKVSAYGSQMQIRELGSINVLDSQNLVVSPWDKSVLNEVAKAIRESELNLNPAVDGDVVRVPVPDLTEERRVELTKIVTTKSEEAKNAIRNIRQDAMKEIEAEFSSKRISEDDKFRQKEETEKTVKEATEKITELADAKKADILKI